MSSKGSSKNPVNTSKSKVDNILQDIKGKYSPKELRIMAAVNPFRVKGVEQFRLPFKGKEITFGVMSDTHLGSKYTDVSHILAAFKEMNKEKCEFLLHAGDLVEGMMGRPGHVLELDPMCIGFQNMLDMSIEVFKRYKQPIFVISGNHDLSFDIKYGIGMDLVHHFCEETGNYYLGINDGDLTVGNTVIKLWHGGDGATARAQTYRDQLIIESLTGGEKPNLLVTGHIHKAHYFFMRNVHCICAGSMQRQTPFMRAKKLAAQVGFWIVKMCIDRSGEVKWIQPRWYPFYS